MKRLLLALCLLTAPPLTAAERPNILWIVSEDNSSHWIGCYGNDQAKTPHIDALAKQGTLFENAYSNAPVCAVARATIITGTYSPTMGTQHMRSRHPIPSKYQPSVTYLRTAGYYCTNNYKTDYNFAGKDASYWDQSSPKAHYKSRPDSTPFFAIFNFTTSHESSLFSDKPAQPQRLKPSEIQLPPYLPDLPEIRKDIARYHDRITQMDAQIGATLAELDQRGLAENTIVIYTSDHGGILPRGKRYLEETGVKIPMIIRIPEKFKNLSPFQPGQRITEPVSFVDFAPTFLSLAGIATPPQMQGRPLLGTHRIEPAEDEMEFLFADRFDELYGMRRGLTDGKWKYIRNFNPHLPLAPYSFYQFGQPGWEAYRKAFQAGTLTPQHAALWKAPTGPEQLYDLTRDPWETQNLATNPAHAEKLATLRTRLMETMKQATDTGLVPEPMFSTLAKDSTIADYLQSEAVDLQAILTLAFAASSMEESTIPQLTQALSSTHPLQRYWGATGLLILGEKSTPAAPLLTALLKDEHPAIRTTAAEALLLCGEKDLASEALLAEITSEMDPPSLLHLLNALRRHHLLSDLPADWAKGKNMKGGSFNYIQRFSDEAEKTQ